MLTQTSSDGSQTFTPWGKPQSTLTIALGITSYTTATHGGYHLSDDRIKQLPDAIRSINTFAGGAWYEEDCDASLVVVAFPECFDPYDVWCACKSVSAYPQHKAAADYLLSPQGVRTKEISEFFERESAHLYRRGSVSSNGGSWTVDFIRISDRHRVTIKGLTSDEAFTAGPIDISIYADRVVPEA